MRINTSETPHTTPHARANHTHAFVLRCFDCLLQTLHPLFGMASSSAQSVALCRVALRSLYSTVPDAQGNAAKESGGVWSTEDEDVFKLACSYWRKFGYGQKDIMPTTAWKLFATGQPMGYVARHHALPSCIESSDLSSQTYKSDGEEHAVP